MFMDEDEEVDVSSLGIYMVLIILGLVYYFCCKRGNRCQRCCCGCCSSCCCRHTNEPDVGEPLKLTVNGKAVLASHLRPKKELGTAYVLWFFLGLFGAHHFYLDRLTHGTISVWSFNLLGMGWICDGMLLPFYCRSCNGYAASEALSDRTCGRIFWRLPLASLTALASLLAIFFFGPRTLHSLHIVDLDQKLAGTSRNPYDILGVTREESREAKATWEAFDAETLRLSILKSCDMACREQKDDLKQIHGFLSGDFWRQSKDEDKWDEYFGLKTEEWSVLIGSISEAVTGKPMEKPRPKPAPKPAKSPAPSRARKRRHGRESEL